MYRYQVSVGMMANSTIAISTRRPSCPVSTGETIFDLIGKPYRARKICFGNHCYGCTAGQGSSCGGATEA